MQYFLDPQIMQEKFDAWRQVRWDWYINDLGIKAENLKWKKHDKLAHYAKEAYDIQFNFRSLGEFAEVEGIHQRGDWDLSQHAKFSGQNLESAN